MEQNIQYQQELKNRGFDYPLEVPDTQEDMELKWQQFQLQEQKKLALLPNYYADENRKSNLYINYNRDDNQETPAQRERRKLCRGFIQTVFWIVFIVLGIIQLSCQCVWQQQQQPT